LRTSLPLGVLCHHHVLLRRVLVGETELTDTAALAADLNENGRPDAADLVLLAAKMQRD